MVVFVVPYPSAQSLGGQDFRPSPTDQSDETTKAAQSLIIPTPLTTHINVIFLPLQTHGKEGIMAMGANIFAVWERCFLLHRDVRGASLSRPAFFCYLIHYSTICHIILQESFTWSGCISQVFRLDVIFCIGNL